MAFDEGSTQQSLALLEVRDCSFVHVEDGMVRVREQNWILDAVKDGLQYVLVYHSSSLPGG